MANLHHAFEAFHDRIALSNAKKAALHDVRKKVRNRIRYGFQSILNLPAPGFRAQGALAMDTAINPIDGEYAMDDGVYLRHLDPENDSVWPSAETVQHWLLTAVSGDAEERVLVRRDCVRVRRLGRYLVDLPAYGRCGEDLFLAARGAILWPRSNPPALAQWFNAKVNLYGEQLRRMIRYLKAWADYQAMHCGKMPCELLLTVFAANHFRADRRDDVALAGTMQAMANAMKVIVFALNPVDYNDVLTETMSESQKDRFRTAVRTAAGDMAAAVSENNATAAARLWQRQFGDRFF